MNLELEQTVSDDNSVNPPEHKETLALISKNSPVSIGVILGSLGVGIMLLTLIAGVAGAVIADRSHVATELSKLQQITDRHETELLYFREIFVNFIQMRVVLESVNSELKKINGTVQTTRIDQQELKDTIRDMRHDIDTLKQKIHQNPGW